MSYDDPVNQAKRLLTFHKDMPWAQKELADLVPLLLEEIEKQDEWILELQEKINE
jgi:hypothetical protein